MDLPPQGQPPVGRRSVGNNHLCPFLSSLLRDDHLCRPGIPAAYIQEQEKREVFSSSVRELSQVLGKHIKRVQSHISFNQVHGEAQGACRRSQEAGRREGAGRHGAAEFKNLNNVVQCVERQQRLIPSGCPCKDDTGTLQWWRSQYM
uniref:Uncharacterized protein n=1 Tax=Aegilops tauschii TaxID=37682 RepID=N1QZD2_AEGTA